MRISLLLLLTGLLAVSSCSNDDTEGGTIPDPDGFRGEVEWMRNFGGSGAETATSIIATQDGGFAVLGYSKSTDGDLEAKSLPVNDYWLLKLNSEAELEWQRTYGGSKDDQGQQVRVRGGGEEIVGEQHQDQVREDVAD